MSRIDEIDAEISAIKQELSRRQMSPSESKAQRYEAAGSAALEYNPELALKFGSQADSLRLNTEKFDYQKAKDLLSLETPDKTQTRELEQLWKDAERSLRFAKQTGDTASIGYYEDLQSKLTNKLQGLRPEIWGETEKSVKDETTDLNGSSANFGEIKSVIASGGVDENNDGVVDNISGLKATVREWARENGVPTNDPKYQDLLANIADMESEVKARYQSGLQKEDIGYSRSQEQKRDQRSETTNRINQDEKFLQSWNALNDLKKSPNDITTKRKALNIKLRKETGAAIGANEFSDMMSFVLSPEAYKQFRDENTGLGNILVGMVSDNAREARMKNIAEKYLDRVDPVKLGNYIDDSISPSYYKKSGSGTPKQSGSDQELILDKIKRLKAQRGAK